MAPPPGSRAVQPVLTPGDLLAGRYRLVRPVDAATPGEAGPARLWLAQDEVLARPVAAKVLKAGGRRASSANAFLQAAADAGMLSSPVLARVYDAAIEERPAERSGRPAGEIDVAYVISEWVDGRRLPEVLAEDGPYDPPQAASIVQVLAEGLSAAHARGLAHGRVHPGNVMFTRGGTVKLTDLAVSAALPDRAVPAERADDPDRTEADVRDLTAVLYGMLTGRWPGTATPQPSGGLPAAPMLRGGGDKRGRLTSPRQVRAGVPTALDALVVRALDPQARRKQPALTTAAGLSDALDRAVKADAPPRVAPATPRNPVLPGWVRRRLPVVAVLAALTALGFTSYALGRDIGEVPAPEDQVAELASPSARPAAAGVPVDVTGVPVRDFDPEGDRRERPGSVPNAHDSDPGTAWETERYDSAAFGGIKPGVGLVVDLGGPVPVTRVEVTVRTPGVTLELRSAAEEAGELAGYRVLAKGRADGPKVALTPPAGTKDRYYLVWVTGLAPSGGKFSAAISELGFTRAPG